MKLFVDTSVLVDHLRGVDAATARLAAALEAGDTLWSLSVVRTEILAGMGRGQDRATRRLLGVLQWQDVTTEIADKAGELCRRYRASHPDLDVIDYLVAAAAQLLKADLLTQSPDRFPMIGKLRAAY